MHLIKPVFNMIQQYAKFKDLARRKASYKVLRDKAFIIAKNPKYDVYQRGLDSMVQIFFDKKYPGSDVANNEMKQDLQLAEELYKPMIKNFKKRTVYQNLKTIFGVLIQLICN